MNAGQHAQTARDFLAASDKEFMDGDLLQGSEKLWGAATHAVRAVVSSNGRGISQSHHGVKDAVEQLAVEQDEPLIAAHFGIAEKFHANFYHGFMEERDIRADRPKVHEFVNRVLELTA